MQTTIHTTKQLGDALRKARKAQGIRQDDIADMIGTSHVYVSELERGAEGANIGGILRLMSELGINMVLDLPDEHAR